MPGFNFSLAYLLPTEILTAQVIINLWKLKCSRVIQREREILQTHLIRTKTNQKKTKAAHFLENFENAHSWNRGFYTLWKWRKGQTVALKTSKRVAMVGFHFQGTFHHPPPTFNYGRLKKEITFPHFKIPHTLTLTPDMFFHWIHSFFFFYWFLF